MKLSILTATYNRAENLKKLYESIKQNMVSNFECEWIIVDDGSTDNTKKVVQKFIDEGIIHINYSYQENNGKMEAINEAVNLATGDLIVDCDSDDIFAENSFQIIKKNANKLFENKNLYALAFLKQNQNGQISGDKFHEENQITTMFDLYFKEDIQGEKILVFNAEIRKNYMHEVIPGEKFVTEARMYHKMDDDYQILAINEAIEEGEYLEDGYTKNIEETFVKAAEGYYNYFKEILERDMTGVLFKKRIYVIKHFILFGYLTKRSFNSKCMYNKINKILYTILFIPGVLKSIDFIEKARAK